MYTVVFETPEQEEMVIENVCSGTSLLDIALGHDIDISCLCGGNGVCKTCLVKIETGVEYVMQDGDIVGMEAVRGSGLYSPAAGGCCCACQSVLRCGGQGMIRVKIL
jgi:ferredoxin